MNALLLQLRTWLCLVLAFAAGAPAAQGATLCIEGPAHLSLSTSAGDEGCGCCETGPAEKNCRCVDVLLSGPARTPESQLRALEPVPGGWIALAPAPQAELRACIPAPRRAPAPEPPRPPGRLAEIRTVVLLV